MKCGLPWREAMASVGAHRWLRQQTAGSHPKWATRQGAAYVQTQRTHQLTGVKSEVGGWLVWGIFLQSECAAINVRQAEYKLNAKACEYLCGTALRAWLSHWMHLHYVVGKNKNQSQQEEKKMGLALGFD